MRPQKGIRTGIKGIQKFLNNGAYTSNWHIFTRLTENDDYAYVTFFSLTARDAINEYTAMGWTFDDFLGNGLYFTE